MTGTSSKTIEIIVKPDGSTSLETKGGTRAMSEYRVHLTRTVCVHRIV